MIPRVADIDVDVDVRAEDLASLNVADVVARLRALHGYTSCFHSEASWEHARGTLASINRGGRLAALRISVARPTGDDLEGEG